MHLRGRLDHNTKNKITNSAAAHNAIGTTAPNINSDKGIGVVARSGVVLGLMIAVEESMVPAKPHDASVDSENRETDGLTFVRDVPLYIHGATSHNKRQRVAV